MNAGRQLNFLSYPPSISVSSNLPSHTQHQSLLLVPRTVLPYQSPLNLPNTHQTPPNKYLANPRPTRGAAPPFIRPLRKTSTQTNIMCWADQCGSCKKMTWAGCGKHIDNALKDVNLSNRCPGWSAGKCPLSDGSAVVTEACLSCGMEMMASTQELMKQVMEAHFQCEPNCAK